MKRFLKGLVLFVDRLLRVALIVLCITVLANLAWLESSYFAKYEVAHTSVEREHERQLAVGELVNSQASWERACDTMRVAFLEERAERLELERQLYVTQSEMYHFVQTLRGIDPDVLQEVLDKMVEPDVWNPFMLGLGQEESVEE